MNIGDYQDLSNSDSQKPEKVKDGRKRTKVCVRGCRFSSSFENLNKQFFEWVDYHWKNHPTANWTVFLMVLYL